MRTFFQFLFKRSKSIFFVVGILSTFSFLGKVSANTAYTGMRNISGLQFTADMGTGWNLGNALDATCGETCWGNPTTTKAMIDKVKAQGFKTIRIPTTWGPHVGGSPNYTIDGNWLNRVETVCNYAFANDMYVILNTHHEGDWCKPTYADEAAVKAKLVAIWTQIANRFRDYGDYLILETLNEPRLEGSAEEWSGGTAEGREVVNRLNKAAVDAIRATGGNNSSRFIMCPPYAAAGLGAPADAYVVPNNDSKVIVSVHNYSPYSFCLQEPGTSTFTSSDRSTLDGEMGSYYNRWINTGRAVVIGEWGSVDKNNTSERASHATYFVQAAKSRQLTLVLWDNGATGQGGMGHLNRSGLSWFFPTIVDAITSQFSGGSCNPTSITPYVQVDGGSWQQTSSITISTGAQVKFGPQPTSGGSWSWSGCGTSGSSREQTVSPTSSCTATAIYTNSCGAQSTQNFNVTVNGGGSSSSSSSSSGGTFNGIYSFIAQHSGKAIDVSGGGTSNGTNVHQWAFSGSNNNQRFQVTPTDNGYHRISPVIATGQCIDVSGVSSDDGANIHTWAYGGGNNQQWRFEDQGGGYYKIIARHSNKCLDVEGVSSSDGANIHQWTCYAGAQNQAFQVIANNSAGTEVSMKEVNIFPNPTVNGVFTVSIAGNGNKMYTMTIYSYDGKKVYENNNISSGKNEIRSGLEKGVYFIQINGDNDYIQKLIIK